MSGFKVPKVKKTPLEKQVKEICKLLTIWPEAPGKAVEQFVRDKFGVEMTRACLQDAKALLKIHEPEYTEAVLTKLWFIRHTVHNLVALHGIGGLSDSEMLAEVRKLLREKFDEHTQERLVKKEIEQCVSDIVNLFGNEDKIKALRQEAKDELIKAGLVDQERGYDLI